MPAISDFKRVASHWQISTINWVNSLFDDFETLKVAYRPRPVSPKSDL